MRIGMGGFFTRKLSVRILALTVGFVLLAEALIFVPSLASFRQERIEDRARAARLLSEALQDRPDIEASDMLAKQFMMQTDAVFLGAFGEGRKRLILGQPPEADLIYGMEDLRIARTLPNFMATGVEFFGLADNGFLRVVTTSPLNDEERLELIVPCGALGMEMRAYARRILVLSLLIAAFVGGLIYLAMLRLIIQPVQRLASDMTAFREAPEIRRGVGRPTERDDEIGQLQREFHDVKQSLRSAFRQRARLASLGLSVTKINHDLRNVLSTALLMADRLSMNSDPDLAQMGERLTRTVERGVSLTEEVLEYSSAREPAAQIEPIHIAALVWDVVADMKTAFPKVQVRNMIDPDLIVRGDPEHVQRIFGNLCRNAGRAMTQQAHATIELSSEALSETVIIQIRDNGPGLPETVEDRLFLPFTRGDSPDSTGLGLSISKELAEGMGGTLELLETGPKGTTFILGLALVKDGPGTP